MHQRLVTHPATRLFAVAVAIVLCLWTVNTSASFGLSRLFARYAMGTGDIAAGKQAVQLTPHDAESHFAHAEVLSLTGRPGESIMELERAIALRPSDYQLWLSLGLLRDQTGDPTAALAAFNEAVKRAPFYAQPRWQRGNLLLRTGQYEAAFKDLNQAAQSDPELIPNLIDLAWSVSKADPKLTEQLAQINTEKLRIAFARFLARQGKPSETLDQFRAAGFVGSDIRRELVEQLLAKEAFGEAFEIWKSNHPVAGTIIFDGGFDAPLTFEQAGFGWRVTRTMPAVTLAVDSIEAHSGSKSLRLQFDGDSSTGSPFVSQLILLEPARRYRISFASRSKDIVSGGLPVIVIKNAGGDKKELGHSTPLSQGTVAWQVSSFEFEVPVDTTAVLLGLQRGSCSTSPCPAFGSIWLDSFSLEQLK